METKHQNNHEGEMRKILRDAKEEHHKLTGHSYVNIFVGFNFVECFSCGWHAHVHEGRNKLIEHTQKG